MKLKDYIEKYGDREIKEDFDIEQYLKPVVKTYLPEVGERYYYLDDCMLVCSNIWGFEECRDPMRYECGNCFRTDQEVKDKVEELKLLQELKELGGREEFIQGKQNWYLESYPEIDCSWNDHYSMSQKLFFDTEEQCKNAIKKIGKERLLKYYFKVEVGEYEE